MEYTRFPPLIPVTPLVSNFLVAGFVPTTCFARRNCLISAKLLLQAPSSGDGSPPAVPPCGPFTRAHLPTHPLLLLHRDAVPQKLPTSEVCVTFKTVCTYF